MSQRVMTTAAQVLDGKAIAQKELKVCSAEIARLRSSGVSLRLATLRTDGAPDAELYFNYLKRTMGNVGIELLAKTFPESVAESDIIQEIKSLNRDPKITGIMVFAPLPKKCDPANIFEHISKMKDVEGRTFLKSHFGVFSPTAHAVLALIESVHADLRGKEAVVVGHSDLVGKPTAVLLMDKFATVAVCHKETRDLKAHVQRADIVVSAAGKAHLIKGDWIKAGAIVIDVGENVKGDKVVGDVEFDEAVKRAAHITPVPGGVGPVTNAMLIKNLLRLRKRQEANGHD